MGIHLHTLMDKEFSSTPASSQSSDDVSFADTVFGFWDSSNSSNDCDVDGDDDEDDESICTMENNKAFWEEQDQLLKAILCRTSSREIKVRKATNEVLRELNMSKMLCICKSPVVANKSCRNCFMRQICDRLLNLGLNSSICKSKWRSSSEIPSGEHTYLEVTDNSSNTKRVAVKVVIELNFRAEFEMARANEEYNQLIKRLPEVYVGKKERLRALVKIMCSAAKTCMKEKKMHIAPWRKHKYMQAKWFGTCERSKIVEPLPIVYSTGQKPKSKASMLTFDLLDNIHGLHCTTVEVV